MLTKESFPKYERICMEKDIDALFKQGKGFSVYPYRIVFRTYANEGKPSTCRLLVSVSKKRFHHAFKRNRVKRLIRESWRKNKSGLYNVCQKKSISVDVALIYNATLIHSYAEMYEKTKKAVHLLIKKI